MVQLIWFIMKQIMLLPIFTVLIASEQFNLTTFSVISDPSGYESVQVNMDATCCMNAVNEYAGVPRLIV